jgi:hypothetical protein
MSKWGIAIKVVIGIMALSLITSFILAIAYIVRLGESLYVLPLIAILVASICNALLYTWIVMEKRE